MKIEFHPMCGTFNGILGLLPLLGKRTTLPLIRSKPGVAPNSSLSVKRICNPRQMPRNGFPPLIDLRIGSIRFSFSRLLMQSLKAPTPGRTIERAFKIC